MGAELIAVRSIAAAVVAVERGRRDREDGPPVFEELYELASPPQAEAGSAWTLVATVAGLRFVARVSVGHGASDEPLAQGAFFRLEEPVGELLALPLPEQLPPTIVVTVENEDGRHLEPAFRFEATRRLGGNVARAEVSLRQVGARSGGGATEIELLRPRGLVPDGLRLATSSPAFFRRVEVWDEGPGSEPGRLGAATVYRLPAASPLAALEIPIGAAKGDRLRIVVHDGDSPALDDLWFAALVRQPALVFSLPAGPGIATLRFGGGRAFRPVYDLAALPARPGETQSGREAELARRLYDPAELATAELGPVTVDPSFDLSPALAFAQRPAAGVDDRRFSHQRAITALPSEDGLVRLPLELEDLALLREDQGDLRVVDGDDRQWPYLLEPASEARQRPLASNQRPGDGRTSRYEVELPVAKAQFLELSLDSPAPFFDRAFWIEAKVGGETRRIAAGRLRRQPGDPRPAEVSLPPDRLESLTVVVDDGDDAPLELEIAARFAAPELYFAALPGRYRLLLGDPEAPTPRYEIAAVRDVVLAVTAGEATTGPLGPNPSFSAAARLTSGAGPQRLLLWVVLALAVLVLSVWTLKLVQKTP